MSHKGRPKNHDQASLAVTYPTERVLGSLGHTPKGPHSSKIPYQYSPLSEERKEIRLMTLHEGDFGADIKVSLHTVPFTPDKPPVYKAFSYVWGSLDNPITIQLGLGTLSITQNLAEALPYLRYEDRPRVLWIDAICVNQQDAKERGLQVKRMVDLYRLAERVVVWLGPARFESGPGIRILDQLASQIEIDWMSDWPEVMKPASQKAEPHWSDMSKALPYDHEEFLAINEILSRPWFDRLWVQQEIRLANRAAIFMCGVHFIDWQSLRKAIKCLFVKSWSSKTDLRERLDLVQSLTVSYVKISIQDLLQSTRRCKCSDARDRVYAILSFLDKSSIPEILEPDYTKTTGEVYQNFALRCMRSSMNDFHILTACGLKDTPSDIPTWVPDWAVVNMPNFLEPRLASGHTSTNVQYRGTGVLSATGIQSATLQQSDRINFIDTYSPTMIAELQRIRKNDDDNLCSSYVSGSSLLAAYYHTFCASVFAELYLPPRQDCPLFQPSLDLVSPKQLTQDDSPDSEVLKYLNIAIHFLEHRSFIKTREGYIGLAPSNALPGDQVCVLLGCQVPMLLRPSPNHQFQVVGECYVYGLMDGEALVGPLPDHYKFVLVRDPITFVNRNAFLDHRTGKVQYNDPRLESVPNYDENHRPNLTPEMIEQRGVKLRTFDLI